jgi:hypothetical protein
MRGRNAADLLHRNLPAGRHEFDLRRRVGEELPSGIYIVRMEARLSGAETRGNGGEFPGTDGRKVILVRRFIAIR